MRMNSTAEEGWDYISTSRGRVIEEYLNLQD